MYITECKPFSKTQECDSILSMNLNNRLNVFNCFGFGLDVTSGSCAQIQSSLIHFPLKIPKKALDPQIRKIPFSLERDFLLNDRAKEKNGSKLGSQFTTTTPKTKLN